MHLFGARRGSRIAAEPRHLEQSLFDTWARNVFRGRTAAIQSFASISTDIMYKAGALVPFVVDDYFTAISFHRNADVGLRLLVMTWVSDRTGHDGHSMIERYRRKARTWNLGELGCLHDLIPELAGAERTVRIRPGLPLKFTARVAKLADAADLGSAAARRKGSTPFPCTSR